MKLVIFTPSAQTSEIANTNVTVATLLEAAGHRVHLVASDAATVKGDRRLAALSDALAPTDTARVREACTDADLVLHHLVNDLTSIDGSLTWLRTIGGHVHLHDTYLGGALADLALRTPARANGLVTMHGVDPSALQLRRMRTDPSAFLPEEPFLRWIGADASTFLVSDPAQRAAIESHTKVVTRSLPFPVAVPRASAAATTPRPTPGRRRVLTIASTDDLSLLRGGIASISASRRLREQISWKIAGTLHVDQRRSLTRFAHELGVHLETVDSTTASPYAELEHADCLLVLRSSALRTDSTDVVNAMRAETPVVVIADGDESRWPSDTVTWVSGVDLQSSLTAFLKAWVDGKAELATDTAATGLASIVASDPDTYASGLIELGEDSIAGMSGELRAVFGRLAKWKSDVQPNPSTALTRAMKIFW